MFSAEICWSRLQMLSGCQESGSFFFFFFCINFKKCWPCLRGKGTIPPPSHSHLPLPFGEGGTSSRFSRGLSLCLREGTSLRAKMSPQPRSLGLHLKPRGEGCQSIEGLRCDLTASFRPAHEQFLIKSYGASLLALLFLYYVGKWTICWCGYGFHFFISSSH